jgi:alpha-L-rhamnosidase
MTFGVSAPGASFGEIPFQQGRHAGKRMLLAEPLTAPGFVQSAETPNGWRLEFSTLPAYIVLDLGRTVHGRIVADVSGPAGSIVDIGWDERLRTEALRPLPYPGSMYPQWNQVDSWVLDGGTRRLTTLDTRAGRYIMIAVWGGGPVRLDNLRVYEERYPLVQVGQFHSSDPLLDQIWQVGVDTLRPNMTDALTDTPWRERGQWWGDAYVEDRVGRIAFGDTALLRRGLIYMADAMQHAPSPGKAPNNDGLHMLDYTMLWVHSLASEVTATHDQDLARRLYPLVKLFIDHLKSFADPQTGLLHLPQQHWSSTAYIDLFGFDSRYGQSAALNAMYADTLRQAAQIADLLGDIDQAADWREQALDVQAGLNALLYQPLDGRYLTSIYLGAPVPPTIHAQAWTLAYGLVPAGNETQVADTLLATVSPDPVQANVGIYGIFWVLQGLGEVGYIEQALQLIRLYYGYLLDAGATTWWEGFSASIAPSASYSHGWGGAPTWFLTTYVLGARRLGPNVWLVKSSFEGVDSASGVLPLADGTLSVAWERVSCGELKLRLIASGGSHGQVNLPLLHPDMLVTVNEEPVWDSGVARADWVSAQGGIVTLDLGDGSYEVIGRFPCMP